MKKPGSNYKYVFSAILVLLCSLMTAACGKTQDDCADSVKTEGSEKKVINRLIINEVYADGRDWVELKNISEHSVNTGDYYLSDNENKPEKYRLPAEELKAGELLLIYCSQDEEETGFNSGFALKSGEETVYLTCPADGSSDSIDLKNIPKRCSAGRMDGSPELRYFETPSPGTSNSGGKTHAAKAPEAVSPAGIYNDVEKMTVELSSETGTKIYYTLDCSDPRENGIEYTEAIEINSTTVIRAIAVGEDYIASPCVSYTYALNENLSLPMLSLCVSDKDQFLQMYNDLDRAARMWGNLSLYDAGEAFSKDGTIRLKGETSIKLAKKSIGIDFDDAVDGKLKCDVFGNGIDEYGALTIRGGQDNLRTVFRNELIQDLCIEHSDKLLTQASKFCVLFINGEYWGIYALKEDLSRQYYASHMNVSKNSVESVKGDAGINTDYYKSVFSFIRDNGADTAEKYEYLCSVIDIDSLIDWIIFEGYTGNSDSGWNVRAFRSSEGDGKWRWCLFDLDWTFQSDSNGFLCLTEYGNISYQMSFMIRTVFRSADFRDRFFTRYAELSEVFSDENLLRKIDEYAALLEPEIQRDEKLRGTSYAYWSLQVERLKNLISGSDISGKNLQNLATLSGTGQDTIREYIDRYKQTGNAG